MRSAWNFYTTHEGISSIRNSELDEKNYYRMKIFMKNYFKDRFADGVKKQTSLFYSIVMSVYGEKNKKENESPFLCNMNIDQCKIVLSWTKDTGLCIAANSKEGNSIIRELYKILKENEVSEVWKIFV